MREKRNERGLFCLACYFISANIGHVCCVLRQKQLITSLIVHITAAGSLPVDLLAKTGILFDVRKVENKNQQLTSSLLNGK